MNAPGVCRLLLAAAVCSWGLLPQPPVPRTSEEVAARVAALADQYAWSLRSLPEPLRVRATRTLEGPWQAKFEVRRASSGRRPDPPDWFHDAVDPSGWEAATVPEWRYEAVGPREPLSCILWYRTQFPAPPPPPGRRVFLVFAGVEWEAEVWLNGNFLGRHRGYCEPFRFEATPILREHNTLAVRVIGGPEFGEPIAYWSVFPDVPAAEQRYVRDPAWSIRGHQPGSLHIGSGFGIHREVTLETTGDPSLGDIFVRGDPECGEARLAVELDAATARQVDLDVQVLPENFKGQSYAQRSARSLLGGAKHLVLAVPTPGAKSWSPEAPYLYRMRVALRQGGKVLDAKDALFGYRSFALVGPAHPRAGLPQEMPLLNDRPYFLRGTNVTGLNAFWYWGQQDKLIRALLLLKAAGFNAIRYCQAVSFPEVCEMLDRLGILSEQDQGGLRNRDQAAAMEQLAAAAGALARQCYNNPGVVLLSLANETHFDPTRVADAVWADDPERIVVPISGNGDGGKPVGYALPERYWHRLIDDFHKYPGWYNDPGCIWKLNVRYEEGPHMVTVGEYGGEALDAYETMRDHYPQHLRPTAPIAADTLWGAVQVQKDDARQIAGFYGEPPKTLGQYIEASQSYQAMLLGEITTGLRLSPRRIAGYFQFHFLSPVAAQWPKSIVSHDFQPKRGYYEMAQLNQPLVPLFRLTQRAKAMEVWVANDLDQRLPGSTVAWKIAFAGQTLLAGTSGADVPACDAVRAATVDLAGIPPSAEVVTIRLDLADATGRHLSDLERIVYLRAFREESLPARRTAPAPSR
jgi:beta-mannosidase